MKFITNALIKNNYSIKYLILTLISFFLNFIFLNTFNFFFTPKDSAIYTLIIIFIFNMLGFIFFYKLKIKIYYFIIIFSLSSIFFRLLELNLFLYIYSISDFINISFFMWV